MCKHIGRFDYQKEVIATHVKKLVKKLHHQALVIYIQHQILQSKEEEYVLHEVYMIVT